MDDVTRDGGLSTLGGGLMLAAMLLMPPVFAWAQVAPTYPHKPIRVIVSVPAGGSPDLVARAVVPGLFAVLGQQLVIDNRGGAGGLIGGELAAKAPADGYTLLITNPSPLVILPQLQKRMPYYATADFAPVGLIAINHTLLVTHPSRPFKTIAELITAARAQPGKLDYASAGNGSVTHLAMALFTSMAGVNMTHVPYKGAPQVPTISESGVPGYDISTWVGLLAPAKTPAPVIALLNDALAKALRMPDVKTQLEVQGVDAAGGTADAFVAFIRLESEKYARAVKLAGIKAD